MSTPPESTAYHEAAHAVLAGMTGVYLMHGIDLRCAHKAVADIERDANLCRAREIANGGKPIDHNLEYGIISAAGSEAERRLMTLRGAAVDDDALQKGALGDLLATREELGVGRWAEVQGRAAHYLSQPKIWSAVEKLAAEVLKRGGHMSGHQVDDQLCSTFADLDFPEFQVLR